MSRLATPAELLAVAESGGREVTPERLDTAWKKLWLARNFDRDTRELKDWREEGAAI